MNTEKFYFKINLNKFGELRQQMLAEKSSFRNLIIFFVVFLLGAFGTAYWLHNGLNRKLDNRVKHLAFIEKQIEQYQINGGYLSAKDLERLADRSTNRIFWTKKLEALAEKTTDEIAITHFDYSKNTLRLYGITPVKKDVNEFSLIDEFIGDLRNNVQISGDFPNIEFKSSYRDREKDVEIMRFQIDLKVKEQDKRNTRSRSSKAKKAGE